MKKEFPSQKRSPFEENIEGLQEVFKENFLRSIYYPDFTEIYFLNNFFYQKLWYYLSEKIKIDSQQPVILELGSYLSRNIQVIPEEWKDRFIISDINFEILKANPPENWKIVLDFSKIPLKEKSADLIIGTNIFSHILGSGDIKEILRILKENGKVIFIEDLKYLTPMIQLYLAKKGERTFAIADPEEYRKEKIVVIKSENFEKLNRELVTLLQENENIRQLLESIGNLKDLEEFSIKCKEILSSFGSDYTNNLLKFLDKISQYQFELKVLFNKFTEYLSLFENNYIDNCIPFSILLRDLVFNFYTRMLQIGQALRDLQSQFPEELITELRKLLESRHQYYMNLLGLFRNFLNSLKEIIEKYSKETPEGSKMIFSSWQDLLPIIEKDFQALGLNFHYELVEGESNYEEIEKYYKNCRKKLSEKDLEILNKSSPAWGNTIEHDLKAIESKGLEIGFQGYSLLDLPKTVKYKALVITVEKSSS